MRPNGVTHAYSYNTLNRLENLTVTAGPTPIASYAYTLGSTGNRTRVVELGGRQVDYGYDALYRLIQEAITSAASNDPRESFCLDDASSSRPSAGFVR